jgi:hypothetical protein
MLTKNVRKIALISLGLLIVSTAGAVVIHDTVRYEHPIRTIRGKVTGGGSALRVVWLDVYDNAQVRLDGSLPFAEQRKRQTRVATFEPDAEGEFKIKHLPKGFYELEFGNRGMGGYNILSVLVNVDPKGMEDRLCVDLSLESGGEHSSVAKCAPK